MSEKFNKVATSAISKFEGGEPTKTKSNAKYRDKCNFDTARNPRLNKNHMNCFRWIKAILCIFNILMNIPVIMGNIQKPMYALSFYSLWGTTIALFTHIASILACNYEGWFKFAYIATEISYAVNTVIVIFFWCLLFPYFWTSLKDQSGPMVTFILWYNGLIHAIPWITTVSDLYMTDMALEKSHWWIAFLTMCPCYMLFNWWGSMTYGSVMTPGQIGNIYGFELWAYSIPLAILEFIISGFAQAGIFYGTAVLIDRIWPKRASEEYNLKEKLMDEEKQKSNPIN